jgi:uncharacterized protein YbjT (DUF2867 family)
MSRDTNGMELITGSTGYMGGRLIERLRAEGRAVRALARDPARFAALDGVDVIQGDVLQRETLARALDGCSTAYYLVHSMEAGVNGFAGRDRAAAENFAAAADDAGLERIVYLGGMIPQGGARSEHLASRLEVEEILLRALPQSTALRASIVIGASSSSFAILVRLVSALRFVPLPSWRSNRTQPIFEGDAIEYLARTPATPEAEGRSLDIIGPEVMTYAEMVERIAEAIGVGRMPLPLPATQTPAASAVVSALTDQPLELVRPLMRSLEHDLLPRNDDARRIYGLKPHPFGRAVDHALRDWERTRTLAAR